MSCGDGLVDGVIDLVGAPFGTQIDSERMGMNTWRA
jgi:hypothetical protein